MKFLVTGSAGFIGSSLTLELLSRGDEVVGFDSHNDYYDPNLKEARIKRFIDHPNYQHIRGDLSDNNALKDLFSEFKPSHVVNLAAQAGVRYSIENPRAYLESNINGTFELLEAARAYPPQHMLLASTSSAYGANAEMPYEETVRADYQMSFYAATKKATENMAHSYSHLFNLPITMFRFFTVYGPWGRPDMALFKFTKAMLNGETIDIYNHGNMSRDFTYIDDLINGMRLLIDTVPRIETPNAENQYINESMSPVAPFRVINIGNSTPVKLTDFIKKLEETLGITAKQNLMLMQAGDVPATWADTTLIRKLTGYEPAVDISQGVFKFVNWYRDFYQV